MGEHSMQSSTNSIAVALLADVRICCPSHADFLLRTSSTLPVLVIQSEIAWIQQELVQLRHVTVCLLSGDYLTVCYNDQRLMRVN